MQFRKYQTLIIVLDRDLKILDVSEGLSNQLSITPDDLIGNSLSSVFLIEDVLENYTHTLHGEGVEFPLIWKAEDVQIEFNGFLYPVNLNFSSQDNFILILSMPLLAISGSDIQKSKLEALGTLAGGIAHDLNNLLMAVLGHLSYLRLSKGLSREESLLSAEEGARTAAKLSQQILDFARQQSKSLTKLDIISAITSSIPVVSPSLPETINVSFRSIDTPLMVYIDETQVTQIVLNLFINARDAMPLGGNIVLEVDRLQFHEPVAISGFKLPQGEYARLRVTDSGHGISDEVKSHIFEPFFTTKKGTGTGLGLATIFFLVKTLKGAIDVKSEMDKGSTFTVFLPIADAQVIDSEIKFNLAKPSIGSSSDKQPVKNKSTFKINLESSSSSNKSSNLKDDVNQANSKSILVVDDEDAVRLVLQRSLELLGYQVVVAENGVKALEIYSKGGNTFSLVVMDMIMPEMAGQELFYKLKEINPLVKVLISSGYSSDGKTQDLLANGAVGFIQKPFAIEELSTEVERCLRK